MTNDEKKQAIEKLTAEYSQKMADIRKRRTEVIQAFVEKARQRRIQEVKTSLSHNGVS